MTSKRTISSANETAFLQSVVRIIVFARLDFAAGTQRFHTEIGPRSVAHPVFGTESYLGIGAFGGLSSDVVETISGAPQQLTLALSGVDSSLINTVMTDDYYRRDVDLMIGLEDEAGDPVDDPVILFSGFMDKVDISLGRETSQLSLSCESRGTLLLSAPDWRYTDEDKQAEVSGDLAGEYIYRMADLELSWGAYGRRLIQGPTDRHRPGPGGKK